MVNMFHVVVSTNSIVQLANSDQKWNNDNYQFECKKYCACKKDYSKILRTCICEKGKHLKHIVDDAVTLKL